jgi:hypothetical protein
VAERESHESQFDIGEVLLDGADGSGGASVATGAALTVVAVMSYDPMSLLLLAPLHAGVGTAVVEAFNPGGGLVEADKAVVDQAPGPLPAPVPPIQLVAMCGRDIIGEIRVDAAGLVRGVAVVDE